MAERFYVDREVATLTGSRRLRTDSVGYPTRIRADMVARRFAAAKPEVTWVVVRSVEEDVTMLGPCDECHNTGLVTLTFSGGDGVTENADDQPCPYCWRGDPGPQD